MNVIYREDDKPLYKLGSRQTKVRFSENDNVTLSDTGVWVGKKSSLWTDAKRLNRIAMENGL